ncbi:hypothetical protein BDW62DRAFT_180175 [Aspergillus aurantiobrunneus]
MITLASESGNFPVNRMDISFPASATILSDAVSIKHQRASVSLVNTVINYSIAIGLGIAGTVEAQESGF